MLLVWNKQNNENYLFDEFSIMYGYHPENPSMFIFNYFILLSKRHVFLSKIDGNSPDICLFLETLKDKLMILRSIGNSKGQVKFNVYKIQVDLNTLCIKFQTSLNFGHRH